MFHNHNYDHHARGSGHRGDSVNAKLLNLDSRVRGNDGGALMRKFVRCGLLLSLLLPPTFLFAQSKPLKEVRVPYALGGSTGFFWVAQRSGSFEKYGLKVLPIFMRGGREAVQALISRDVSLMQQGSSGVITAWAQGAKDLVAIGATGNKLDYIFMSTPAIKNRPT